MAGYPNINGREFSWASIELRLDGAAPMVGFTAIKYSDKIEEEQPRGASRQPLGRTRGKYSVEDCSLTMLEGEFRQLVATLGDGWGDGTHTIVVQYADTGMTTATDTLEGVRFLGVDGGAEEGTEGLKREVSFSALKIKRDGKYLIAGMK